VNLAETARRTGSEVMGVPAPNRQLAPTVDSLRIRTPSRLRHSRFPVLDILYHAKSELSNIFFPGRQKFFLVFALRRGKEKKIDKRSNL